MSHARLWLAEEEALARDQWEYCQVWISQKEIHFFTLSGEQVTKVKDPQKAVAELGMQGWELVTAAFATMFSFKRRVE